jgi:hypothetical protein
MKFKSLLAKPFANYIYRQIRKGMATAVADQDQVLQVLIKSAAQTEFGKDHSFADIKTHADFVKHVPLRDYEALKPYIDKIKEGKHNILWKGQPIYFAKTSGTTSGAKYIPITKDSIPNHINTARNALLCYMAESGNSKFAAGKLIFLSGSPVLERVGGIPTGRLSGIVNHHIPKYLRNNQLPSYETNCIEDWEEKLDKIVDETINEDMTLISGIPPWMQMYFDKLEERSGKKIGELFPNFSVMVQGGVNYQPYKAKLTESIGREIDTIELFPASEGFFAFRDSQKEPGMLLNTNSGIFYEFVKPAELGKKDPQRLTLKDVEIGENYALIISSNAGLWGYNTGDTVKFVSTDPYRIIVSGRTKQYISAFGEHVITEEAEAAVLKATTDSGIKINEFTVAPFVSPDKGKSYHEWFIEFEDKPADLSSFTQMIDDNLRAKNVYYDDLIKGNILQRLIITPIKKAGFNDYMKSIGKLGGQNKIPKLSNDRVLADALSEWRAK